MPPKSWAEVASAALTPDSVCSPALSFSGGAHATAARTRADAAKEVTSRGLFIAEPSDGQEAVQWRSGYRAESSE
jgi:hypothetical protein